MKQPGFHLSRALQWLGWDRSEPSVAALFVDDAVWMLALRDRPLRVTACGSMPLSVGTVRNGEVRLVGFAADAMRTLRTFLKLADTAPLTIVVDPLDADADPQTDTVVAKVDKRQLEALARCGEEADSANLRFDPVPASIARLARLARPAPDTPLYAGGAGWLSASLGKVSEIAPAGSSIDLVSAGATPSSLVPISTPSPVRVRSQVELDGPWQLLLGAALGAFAEGPRAVIETHEQAATYGWAAEQIVGMAR